MRCCCFFLFKQKTAYEMRISDWSSDVCSSDLYIIRTSWVIGDGNNFVRTMATLAQRGINPTVVNDQTGRLTFTPTITTAIHHLLHTHAPYAIGSASCRDRVCQYV